MAKSYLNTVNEVEVSLAIEQLLIADYTQDWTPARVDFDSPPTGFKPLGAVAEDTPNMVYSREKFQLQTGIPKVTQFEAIMSMEGRFECSLHSNSWRKVQYALGNYTAAASATVVATVSSVVNTSTYVVTSGESLTAYRQYIFGETAANFDDADGVETIVTSVSTTGSNAVINVKPAPLKTVAANWAIGAYDYVRQVFGSSQINYYKILGVADFIDGVQVVHQLMKVSPADEFSEQFRPDDNGKIPLTFNALGVQTTINSCTELIVGDRYYFPKTTQC
jgi:hypothetical protein